MRRTTRRAVPPDKHRRCTSTCLRGCTRTRRTLPAMTGILNTLEREWHIVSDTPTARRAARRWATYDPILAASSPGDLVTSVRNAPSHHRAQEAVNALAQLAANGDTLAARTALQIVLPLIFHRTIRALAAVGYSSQLQADAHAEAVAAALDRIYRLHTQPTPTPLWSIERAVRSRLTIWLRQHHNRPDHPTDPNILPEPDPTRIDTDPTPAEQLLKILGEAVSEGAITADGASIVAATRIAGASFEDLARSGSRRPITYSRHRQRTEAALAEAVLAAAS